MLIWQMVILYHEVHSSGRIECQDIATKTYIYNVQAKMVDGCQNSEKVRPSTASTIEGKIVLKW